ncbi:hypothetical protein ACLOJK_036309 [Asimina triloba]
MVLKIGQMSLIGWAAAASAVGIAGVAGPKWRRCKVGRLMSSDLDEWAAGLELPWRTGGRDLISDGRLLSIIRSMWVGHRRLPDSMELDAMGMDLGSPQVGSLPWVAGRWLRDGFHGFRMLDDGSMREMEHRIAVLRRCTKIRVHAVCVCCIEVCLQ